MVPLDTMVIFVAFRAYDPFTIKVVEKLTRIVLQVTFWLSVKLLLMYQFLPSAAKGQFVVTFMKIPKFAPELQLATCELLNS